jgi:hypothetical protein
MRFLFVALCPFTALLIAFDPFSRGAVFAQSPVRLLFFTFNDWISVHTRVCRSYFLVFFLLGCFFTAAFAILTAFPSSPDFSRTALAVLAHCFFLAGVLAFFVCFIPLAKSHGMAVSYTRVQAPYARLQSVFRFFLLALVFRAWNLVFHGFTLSIIRDFAPVNVMTHTRAKKKALNCRQNTRCNRHTRSGGRKSSPAGNRPVNAQERLCSCFA